MTTQTRIPLTETQISILKEVASNPGVIFTQDNKKSSLRLVTKKLVYRVGKSGFKATKLGYTIVSNRQYREIR